MITNELLEEKYQAQRLLAEQGGDDLDSYVQHVHQVVLSTERKYGLKFRYVRVKKPTRGTRVKPVHGEAAFQAMLDAAEQRIQETGGISHEDVWKEMEK